MIAHLASEVLAQVHRVAPRSHALPFALTGLVLVPLLGLGARGLTGTRGSALLGGLAGGALSVALSLTLFRGGFGHGSWDRLRGCAVTGPSPLSGDGAANLLLLAPAAFLAVLAVGRPGRVVLGVACTSLAIEGVQAVQWVGVCDSSDVVLNVVGGLVAAVLAAALRCAVVRVPGSGPCLGSC